MNKPQVISLFTGAGGLDYGLEAAGFETAVALEMDRDCCRTLRANRPWPLLERNLLEVSTEELLGVAGLRKGDAALLVGGPPCQPFSKSGYWSRGDSLRLEDPRASTLGAYLRVLEETLPRAFLLENVEGLAFRGKDEGLRLLLTAIAAIGKRTGVRYEVSLRVLNSAAYGVPQLRHRVILVGSRDGRPFRFPEPTHGEETPGDLLRPIEPYRTAWDALADLAPEPGEDLRPRGKWADLLASIPEGQNYLWHTERQGGLPLFGWRRRYWSFLLKLAKRLPSWTIQAQPGPASGPFHWKNRLLSARELCRLQTFPDDVHIQGGRTAIQRQIGNAVPSLLAEVLGRAIREQLLGLPPQRRPLRLLPARQSTLPPPEPVRQVPLCYRPLEGRHSPHPGTGRGFGANARLKSAAAAPPRS